MLDMKRQIMVGVVSAAVALAAVMPSVSAQQSTPGSSGGAADEMKARIIERKTRLNTKLSNAEAAKLRDTCKPAQAKIATIMTTFNQNSKPVTEALSTRAGVLQQLTTYASTKKVDTTQYVAVINPYSEAAESLVGSIATFNLSLSDLKGIDCVNDTTGFKATLDSARNEFAQIKQKEVALTKQNSAVISNLKTLKAELEK